MSYQWDFSRSYAENEAAMQQASMGQPAAPAAPVATPAPAPAPQGILASAIQAQAGQTKPMDMTQSWGAGYTPPSQPALSPGLLGSAIENYAPPAWQAGAAPVTSMGEAFGATTPTPTPKPAPAGAGGSPLPGSVGGPAIDAGNGVTIRDGVRYYADGSSQQLNENELHTARLQTQRPADGRVHLYGGYSTDWETYNSRPQNTGPAVFGAGGSGSPGATSGVTKPLQVGGGASGGASGGSAGGSSGGASGGSVGAPGATGSVTNRGVDYGTETIEGRIKNLLGTDANGNYINPVIQQAANTALQQFAGRGLLNSSMATEAAYQAAMSKAIEIAGPDAQTYFSQGRANQDAANVFERDARGYAQENYRLDRQLSVDMDKFNRELQYRYDALKIDKATQDDARALAQKYALEMENVKSVNSAYDLYLRRISDIDANPEYSAEVKAKMKNEAGKDFDVYAKAKGIAWDMRLADRFTTSAPAPSPAPAPAPAPAGNPTL